MMWYMMLLLTHVGVKDVYQIMDGCWCPGANLAPGHQQPSMFWYTMVPNWHQNVSNHSRWLIPHLIRLIHITKVWFDTWFTSIWCIIDIHHRQVSQMRARHEQRPCRCPAFKTSATVHMDKYKSILGSYYIYMNTNWSWWHHQMEIFSALLGLCDGNPQVTGEFPSQRPVTRSFDFFDMHLNKRLSKQSICRWFETPSCSLWRHCNDDDI